MSDGVRRVLSVVVAKDFARAKSRLSEVLEPEARAALSRQMLIGVVSLCRASPRLEGTWVATDAEDVAQVALAMGAQVLRDTGDEVLGRVVDRAVEQLRGVNATHVVVWMSDLPRLHASDLVAVLDALEDTDVVIGPDRQRRGTNMLALRLTRSFATCFGRDDSFVAHQAAARAQGLRVVVIERPGIAFDLDTPDDYFALKS